jgi:hypothetical protein
VIKLPLAEYRQGGLQNGYVSSGTGGHFRPLLELKNRLVSSENVPARAREWTRVPYLSFPRNEGVSGSSPGVGSGSLDNGATSVSDVGNAGHGHSEPPIATGASPFAWLGCTFGSGL